MTHTRRTASIAAVGVTALALCLAASPAAGDQARQQQHHRHRVGVHGQPRAVVGRPVASPTRRTPTPRCLPRPTPRSPLRNLDGSGYLRGSWVTVQSATGTPAYCTTNTFSYTRHQDQFEQVMAYFWVNQAQEYLQSLGFGSTLPGIVKQSVRRQDRPVRRRQLLPDRQALPRPAGQGRGRRRGGRRGDRPRVRPRRARVAGPRLRRQRGGRLDRRVVRRLPRRLGRARRGRRSTAGRSRPRRRARWTGTPRPTRTRRTASDASTST